MHQRRYPFEGGEVTATELRQQTRLYSRRWLAYALAAGCSTWKDLAKRWQERAMNQHRSQHPRSHKVRPAYRKFLSPRSRVY